MQRTGNDQAASELVGALLLVLVVASAAIGFGNFYLQQQKEAQALEQLEAERAAERLDILAIAPTDTDVPPPDGDWDTLDFILVNAHTRDLTVRGLSVNGNEAKTLVVNPGPDQKVLTFDPADTDPAKLHGLKLGPLDRAVVRLEDASAATHYFTAPAAPLATDQEVLAVASTERGNRFEALFLPPSAIVLVRQEGGATSTAYVLDGSRSDTVTEGAFLVSWTWTVTPLFADPDGTVTAHGRIAMASTIGNDPAETPGSGLQYTLTLTVRDSHGMAGTAGFTLTL